MGAKVILACRSEPLGREAVSNIKKELGSDTPVELMSLDLTSLQSIREFSKSFHDRNLGLHFLVNNAGVMACPAAKTKDGFELQFGTNHLGHFLLTNLLLPDLKKSAPSRIVNLSSLASERSNAKIHWDDLQLEKSYTPWLAYGQSKLANVLFTRELAKRLKGTGVTTFSLHPGAVVTELGRHLSLANKIPVGLFHLLGYLFPMKTSLQGAQTSLYACLDPELESHSGEYLADCRIKYNVNPLACDDESARRLWEVSEQLVGLKESHLI